MNDETYRGSLTACLPDGDERATVIVTRQGLGRAGRVWLTLHGSVRATVAFTNAQVDELQQLLSAAKATRP